MTLLLLLQLLPIHHSQPNQFSSQHQYIPWSHLLVSSGQICRPLHALLVWCIFPPSFCAPLPKSSHWDTKVTLDCSLENVNILGGHNLIEVSGSQAVWDHIVKIVCFLSHAQQEDYLVFTSDRGNSLKAI